MPQEETQEITRQPERTVGRASSNLAEVLDKGIVVDLWADVSIVGIELLTVEARIIVASLDTYIRYAEELKHIGPIAGSYRSQGKHKSLAEGLSETAESVSEAVPLVGNAQSQTQEKKSSSKPRKKKTARSKRGK